MSKILDKERAMEVKVSRAEQYSWASLTSLGIIFWWFQMRMLDGWTIVDQSAERLLSIYFVVIAATIALEVVIAVVLDALGGGKAPAKDERDLAIDARAGLNERLFFIGAINVLVWQALWEGALDGHGLPRIDLTRLPTLFFALFTILFIGEAVKRLSTIWLYRAQATHD